MTASTTTTVDSFCPLTTFAPLDDDEGDDFIPGDPSNTLPGVYIATVYPESLVVGSYVYAATSGQVTLDGFNYVLPSVSAPSPTTLCVFSPYLTHIFFGGNTGLHLPQELKQLQKTS